MEFRGQSSLSALVFILKTVAGRVTVLNMANPQVSQPLAHQQGEGNISVSGLRGLPHAKAASEAMRARMIPHVDGEPLWTYSPGEPLQFLSALIRAIDMLSILESHGTFHGEINPSTVILKDRFTAENRTDRVCMIDLDSCHKHASRLEDADDTASSPSNSERSRPSPTSPVTMWFAALDKLRSIRVAVPDAEPSPRHFDHAIHHDLESLIWVATYSLYRRAYEVARHPLSGADELEQEVVEDALNADFGNADAAVVTLRRQAMASRGLSGLYSMLHYFDAPLRDFVLGLMDRVHAQNRHDLPPLPHMAPETMEELLTCEGLKQYIVSYIAEHFTPPDDAQRR